MRRGDVFKKTMTHHLSQEDASYHVRQHARMVISLLHSPFVFRANYASTDAALNINETT
jgi:hypothetical protein